MSSTINDSSTSATYQYALAFYELLVSQAKKETVVTTVDSENYNVEDLPTEVLVWRGKLQDAFEELGISNVYYSRIRRIFIKYDCVTYIQRGTKSYESVLILNHAPPAPENISPEDLTASPGTATIQAQAARLDELEHTVRALEVWRENLGGLDIVEMARNFEARLKKVETGGSNAKKQKATE